MKIIEFFESVTLDKDPDVTFFRLRQWDPFQLSRVLLNVPMDAQKLKDIKNWKKSLFKKSKKDFISYRENSDLTPNKEIPDLQAGV